MSIFKKKDNNENISANPYLNARAEWLERYGDYIARARNWQVMAFLSVIASIICILFLGYISTQNKLIPYVIEVDKLGNTAKVGVVGNLDFKNPNVIKYSINTFIYSWRTVWGNPQIQRKFVLDAYKYIAPRSKAYNYLNDYYQKENPFEMATKENVNVKIKSIIPQNANTWQVEWEEIRTNLASEILNKTSYRAFLEIAQIIPTTEEQILENPLGIFILDINYAKVL